ncbi:MAG: hypothetical protein M0C28_14165 [Candidatus Moduliflexus flocculans]|nr:hypothetical protein [Candidatus Moduliflexus flocculans]
MPARGDFFTAFPWSSERGCAGRQWLAKRGRPAHVRRARNRAGSRSLGAATVIVAATLTWRTAPDRMGPPPRAKRTPVAVGIRFPGYFHGAGSRRRTNLDVQRHFRAAPWVPAGAALRMIIVFLALSPDLHSRADHRRRRGGGHAVEPDRHDLDTAHPAGPGRRVAGPRRRGRRRSGGVRVPDHQ